MINPSLFTSRSEHYCSPPKIVAPMRRVLVPRGCVRQLLDPASNGASIVGAHLIADGEATDGLKISANVADCWYQNPPYGTGIDPWVEWSAYWGRECGVPGISLLPARVDTKWCRKVFESADAWLFIDGRLTFWVPIPLTDTEAIEKGSPAYFLQRWRPHARRDDLPAPFRLLSNGLIVGPELGTKGGGEGKPQSAPFPSMVAFWADPETAEPDMGDEIEVLRSLVRGAARSADEEWLAMAKAAIGKKALADDLHLSAAVLARYKAAADRTAIPRKHPICVRTFAAHFGKLGTLTVARGRHAGVWRL